MQMPGQIVISTNVDYNNEYTVIIVNKQLYFIIIINMPCILHIVRHAYVWWTIPLWNDYEIPDCLMAE